MNDKRQINGTRRSITELVDEAMASADSQPLDMEKARQSLMYLGHRNPEDHLVIKYARESAICAALSRMTGANFKGQLGKIDFSSREQAIAGVHSYLDRRNQGQHSRWAESHKRY